MIGGPIPLDAAPSCVHCGFCLPACPTWSVLGNELDTPRGRLMLMEGLRDGRLSPEDPGVVRHLDACLGCRACETACPSAVPYGRHLHEARVRLSRSRARPAGERLLLALVLAGVAAPAWLARPLSRLLAGLARRLPTAWLARRRGRLAAGLLLLARIPAARDDAPHRPSAAAAPPRRRVVLLRGCVQDWLFGPTQAATVRLLEAAGCEVRVPDGQVCCGALHAHAGKLSRARRLARRNLRAFARAGDFDVLVTNAAGCGAHLRELPELFPPDSRQAEAATALAAATRDALELLGELGLPPPRRPVTARVALHDACHLVHAQGVRGAPRDLLSRVPGLALVPLADADRCCGSAGIYNLLHPAVAARLGEEKACALAASGAQIVAAANPGCLLHVSAALARRGTPLRTAHPLDLLDEATRP